MKRIAVWSDVDLDGAASQLVIRWMQRYYGVSSAEIEVSCSTSSKLRAEFTKWLNSHKVADYDEIYFVDLDTIPIIDLIDHDNVYIYDHHKSHIYQRHLYQHAIATVDECKSTAQLIYNTFKAELGGFLTDEQKKLILIVSDYDSYTLDFKESKKLNTVYWGYIGNRIQQFMTEWENGFSGFNESHLNTIRQYENNLQCLIRDLEPFKGEYEGSTVISVFCTTAHNDIAEYVIDKFKADIVALVNTRISTVSFRKRVGCEVDLSVVAHELCEGGGHAAAAGGKIIPSFLEFAKTLSPLKTR